MKKYINKNAMERAEREFELLSDSTCAEINLMALAIEDVANGDMWGVAVNWSKVYKYCEYLEMAFCKIAKREKWDIYCEEYPTFRGAALHNTVVVLTNKTHS